jgi:hypothetical protein
MIPQPDGQRRPAVALPLRSFVRDRINVRCFRNGDP